MDAIVILTFKGTQGFQKNSSSNNIMIVILSDDSSEDDELPPFPTNSPPYVGRSVFKRTEQSNFDSAARSKGFDSRNEKPDAEGHFIVL
jgi:hypothetical protein